MSALSTGLSSDRQEARPSTGSGRAGSLLVLALLCASCGTPMMKLPSGPDAPAPDAADALTQATAACRAIRTLTAEVAAGGKAAGSRFRGRLSVGVAAPASARIEAVAPFGPPVFIFTATDDDATCCCRATTGPSSTAVRPRC
jgi:hypothetical protein